MTIISSDPRKDKMQGLVTFLKGLNVSAFLIERPANAEQHGYWEVGVSEHMGDIAKHLYCAWLDRRRKLQTKLAGGVRG